LSVWEHAVKNRSTISVDDDVYKGTENNASGSSVSGFVTFMLRGMIKEPAGGAAFECFSGPYCLSFRARRPGASASSPPTLRVEERLDLIHEFVDVLELAVNRGEPHIGHFVEVLQCRHDLFTYP
jgi:hypothetical protein